MAGINHSGSELEQDESDRWHNQTKFFARCHIKWKNKVYITFTRSYLSNYKSE
jgi:hypothetical protein